MDRASTTFVRIFTWNLAFTAVVVVTTLQGALIWGTRSLALGSGRITLSFATIFGRSGIFELSAYVFVALATQEVMIWHQASPSYWREDCERIRLSRDWNFSRREILVLLIGLRLLVAANYCEASSIMELFG